MRTLIVGNWKMNKTVREALAFMRDLIALSRHFPPQVEVVVAPPFTALETVARTLKGRKRIQLGAQTMHWQDGGAYTGEISPMMLRDVRAQFVILGHSERREMFGETDGYVRMKTVAALAHGISPIVAVGETLEEHKGGRTMEKVVGQTRAALEGLALEELARCVVAYEPIWAIGSGMSDDPQNANLVMRTIRASVDGLDRVPLLYGGSVNQENMAGFAAESDINGALVGGASLDARSFAAIIAAAQKPTA